MPGPTAAAGGDEKRATAFSMIAAGQRAPAAVEHRHLLAVRERDGIAIGHQHEQADAGLGG